MAQIFVDGCGGRQLGGRWRSASSGFAVTVADGAGKHFFHGFFGAMVSYDSSDQLFIGSDRATSGSGELCAQVWVALWIAQAPFSRYLIHYDSMYVDNLAMARDSPKVNAKLAIVAAGLMFYAFESCVVGSEHVKAHASDPWNELADTICNVTSARNHRFAAP